MSALEEKVLKLEDELDRVAKSVVPKRNVATKKDLRIMLGPNIWEANNARKSNRTLSGIYKDVVKVR